VAHRRLLTGLLWLVCCLSASAEVLTNGLPMTTASTAMQKAGYVKTGLDMLPRPGSGEELRFWGVGPGVLIVRCSRSSQKITGMTFWLADEHSKALRRTFELDVMSFDTSSGALVIRTKKGGPEGSANRSQPVGQLTNPTSSAARAGR